MRGRVKSAGKRRSGSRGLGHTGLGSDSGAIAYLDVVHNPHLSSQDHLPADSRASGNSRLGSDHRVLSNHNVVGNLNQVINFYSATYDGSAQRGTVYGCIGSDFYVVVDLDGPNLWDFTPHPTFHGIPETVASHDHPGVENYPIPDTAALADRDLRMEDAILPDLDSLAEKHAWEKNGPPGDPDSGPQVYIGEDGYPFSDDGGGMNRGVRADSPVKLRLGGEQLQDFGKCKVRLLNLEKIYLPSR